MFAELVLTLKVDSAAPVSEPPVVINEPLTRSRTIPWVVLLLLLTLAKASASGVVVALLVILIAGPLVALMLPVLLVTVMSPLFSLASKPVPLLVVTSSAPNVIAPLCRLTPVPLVEPIDAGGAKFTSVGFWISFRYPQDGAATVTATDGVGMLLPPFPSGDGSQMYACQKSCFAGLPGLCLPDSV